MPARRAAVGYGDISAENTAERIVFVIMFIVGAFIWGDLLSKISDISASSRCTQSATLSNTMPGRSRPFLKALGRTRQ